jgi:hypothetical protein
MTQLEYKEAGRAAAALQSLAEIQEGKQQEKQRKEMEHEEVHKGKALEVKVKWGPPGRCVRLTRGGCPQ